MGGREDAAQRTPLNFCNELFLCMTLRRYHSGSGSSLFLHIAAAISISETSSLNATSYMKNEYLELKEKIRTKVEKITVPATAVAIEKVFQMSTTMLHANALRHNYT